MGDDDESCTCDVCADATRYRELSSEDKFALAWPKGKPHKVGEDWEAYALGLEAENYDLVRENADLREELGEERARCQNCGRHK